MPFGDFVNDIKSNYILAHRRRVHDTRKPMSFVPSVARFFRFSRCCFFQYKGIANPLYPVLTSTACCRNRHLCFPEARTFCRRPPDRCAELRISGNFRRFQAISDLLRLPKTKTPALQTQAGVFYGNISDADSGLNLHDQIGAGIARIRDCHRLIRRRGAEHHGRGGADCRCDKTGLGGIRSHQRHQR